MKTRFQDNWTPHMLGDYCSTYIIYGGGGEKLMIVSLIEHLELRHLG